MKLMPREDFVVFFFFFDMATLNAALVIYIYLITGMYLPRRVESRECSLPLLYTVQKE